MCVFMIPFPCAQAQELVGVLGRVELLITARYGQASVFPSAVSDERIPKLKLKRRKTPT